MTTNLAANIEEFKGYEETINDRIFEVVLRRNHEKKDSILTSIENLEQVNTAFETTSDTVGSDKKHILLKLYRLVFIRLGRTYLEIVKTVTTILNRVKPHLTSGSEIVESLTLIVFNQMNVCFEHVERANGFSKSLQAHFRTFLQADDAGHRAMYLEAKKYEDGLHLITVIDRKYKKIVNDQFDKWEKQVIINVENLVNICMYKKFICALCLT